MAEIGKDGWLMKGSAWNEEDVRQEKLELERSGFR